MKRKDFIQRLSMLAAGTTIQLHGIDVRAFHSNPFKVNLEGTEGKILVLLQMQGGNDGLNTLIPFEDAQYYNARKTIGISKESTIKLSPTIGLHPSMQAFKGLYDQGKLAIVQNVGYQQPDRSHFRATDIWLSASDTKQYVYEGWAARFLEQQNPAYPVQLPNAPMAIQLGSVESMLLQGTFGSLGTVFEDPNQFYQLISGSQVDTDQPPNTPAGAELKYLRAVATSSIAYSEQIKTKADQGKNTQTYPNTSLGRQLAIVAKLISGGLQTPVYLTTIGGFDTHANQLNAHANLLTQVSQAMAAFQTDLEALGIAEQVCLMTFSEFGRRVKENATTGTDHGTAAPLFVMGKTVKGGLLGAVPNLGNLDSSGDIKHEFDFRQIYSSILQDHFSIAAHSAKTVLFKDFSKLPLFRSQATETSSGTITLQQNRPNPVDKNTEFVFSNLQNQQISLHLYNMQGLHLAQLASGSFAPGVYTVPFDTSQLPQGIYAYSLSAASGHRQTMRMIVKR
jgi:uncharacterized protein (DUF1501 family)